MGLIGLVMALTGPSRRERQHHSGYSTQPVHYVPTHPINNGLYVSPQRSSCHQRKCERRVQREYRRAERTLLRAEYHCDRAVRRAERRDACWSRRQPVPMGQRGGYATQGMGGDYAMGNRQPVMYAPQMETRGVQEVKSASRSVSTATLREDAPPAYEEVEKKN